MKYVLMERYNVDCNDLRALNELTYSTINTFITYITQKHCD